MSKQTQSPIWKSLKKHQNDIAGLHLRDLFADDPSRFDHFSLEAAGLFLDYSKNRITQETLRLLIQLAEERHLAKAITDLFSGEKINQTEQRPALHTALRSSNERKEVQKVLAQMQTVVDKIEHKQYLGFNGEPITDVINIGIGGSDLGPALVYDALSAYRNQIRCHCLANNDYAAVLSVLKKLNPATTLVLFVSKSFTTQETFANAEIVKQWMMNAAGDFAKVESQWLAITAATDNAKQYGILAENILPMWNWVGGRFSLWSAVGLSDAIALGINNFKQLLAGAYAMDQHFQNKSPLENMPVILALLGVWMINFFNCDNRAIIPYSNRLELLPDYLQQLHMESLGKSVTHDGERVDFATGNIIWGGVGSNSQHSFHQLLMQGTPMVPVDFILPIKDEADVIAQRYGLLANCLAQSKTMMLGYTAEEITHNLQQRGVSEQEIKKLLPHKVIVGNVPSNTILMEKLTPYHLGALLALYEHKVYVQSVIWQINAFDQWGVERGKKIAKDIFADLQNDKIRETHDASTKGLLNKIKKGDF